MTDQMDRQWMLPCALFCFLSVLNSGCGYTLKNSTSLLLEREGVQKIYLAPMHNNTYKAGVEQVLYNKITRTLKANLNVALVGSSEDADAVLETDITAADYAIGSTTAASRIKPINLGPQNLIVATDYRAQLSCAFTLNRKNAHSKEVRDRLKALSGTPSISTMIWSTTVTRSKNFPGNNQLSVLGTTSALINDSEFDRALSDLAEAIASDVNESLQTVF